MKNNRRHLIIILIVIMASVFFVSCGIPTYRTLSGIKIKTSKIQNGYSISFTGSDSDLEYVKDGPGLILLYVESESNANTFSSTVISKFSENFGNSSSIGKQAVVIDSDNPVLDIEDVAKVYAFKVDGSTVSPWRYCFDISSNSNSNSIFSTYSLKSEDNVVKVTDGTFEHILTKANGETFNSGSYVHVFTAFSCQSTNNNNFSNIYWSNLSYVGYFNID